MKYSIFAAVLLILAGGCTELTRNGRSTHQAVEPTVVFKPADSTYLLSCISEVDKIKKRDFSRHYKEISRRLKQGDDKDTLRFICLSLSRRASARQFAQGRKKLQQYIREHPDSDPDMAGLLLLVRQIDRVKNSYGAEYKKLQAERNSLQAEIETLREQTEQDKGRIEELQRQIDQLKNIESIIKSREKQK
jgi:chromosome segregation ATPase